MTLSALESPISRSAALGRSRAQASSRNTGLVEARQLLEQNGGWDDWAATSIKKIFLRTGLCWPDDIDYLR
jgi:hypothetical protein